MSELEHRIDFLELISVYGANPNGDPLCGNRPRTDSDGYGIISDVCIKRKLRDRLHEMGEEILITPPTDKGDSISRRTADILKLPSEDMYSVACGKWYDVRAFGQIFTGASRLAHSLNVTGAVTIHSAVSADIINIEELPITRCINSAAAGKRGTDTLGFRYRVKYGLYVLKGSVNVHYARKNSFTAEDSQKLKHALIRIFENDSSASRPAGSMVAERLYWWEHGTSAGDIPAHVLFDSVMIRLKEGVITPHCFGDYETEYHPPENIRSEIIKL